MHPFLFRVICLVLGIQWGFRTPMNVFSLLLPISLIILGWLWRRRGTWIRLRRLVFFGSIGFLWAVPQSSLHALPTGTLPLRDVLIEGRIEGPKRFTEERINVRLSEVIVRDLDQWIRLPGDVRLSVPHAVDASDWHRGSTIAARVRLNHVRPLANPGQTNWGVLQLRRGVQATGWVSDVSDVWAVVDSNSRETVWVDKARHTFRNWCNDYTHPSTAGLLQAIVLGDSSVLDDSIRVEWRDAGLAHLLAISGLHIGLIAWVVFRFCSWILSLVTFWSRRWPVGPLAGAFAVMVAWTYVWVAGAPISALRAGWMVTGLFGAQWVGRRTDSISGLSLALLMVVCWDPNAPLDPAFQLSFLAVGSLLLGMKSVEQLATRFSSRVPWVIPRKLVHFFMNTIGASLLCTCSTAPIIWGYFDTLSVHGLWANVLAIPLVAWGLVIPGLLAFVSVALDINWLVHPIALWLDFGASHALGLAQWVSNSVHAKMVTVLIVVLISVVLSVKIVRWFRQGTFPFILFCISVIIVLLSWSTLVSRSDELRVTFLAVGHGDCVVIQTPNGNTILVDSGGDPTGKRRVGRDIVIPALRSLGIDRIDWAVITHPHPDHFLGFNDIVDEIPIRRVLISEWSEKNRGYSELLARFRSAHVPIHDVGDWNNTFLIDGVRFQAMSANRLDESSQSLNDRSIVIRLAYGAFSVLLTGDIEKDGEAALVRSKEPLRSTVLKVPHHGSNTSSSHAFISKVDPEWAVIQCREGGRFNFPHPDIAARFQEMRIPVSVTGHVGAVQIRTDGNGWSVSRFR